jgi:hypothetical protein
MVNFLTYPACEFDKLVTRGQSPIRHVEFGPKGRFLAVSTDDGVIRYINVQMPNQFTVLKGHSDSVRAWQGTSGVLGHSARGGGLVAEDGRPCAFAHPLLPSSGGMHRAGALRGLRSSW